MPRLSLLLFSALLLPACAGGASHCDSRVRRQTLPDTLRWMWRGYPIN